MGNSVKKVNINKIISKAVNAPTKDEFPLYRRIDNLSDNGINRTDNWLKAVERVYSSPDNVRRLFITYKGVYVHLHQPVAGSKNTSLVREVSYGANTDMQKIAVSILSGSSEYSVTGDALGVLLSPWVIQNIEEVYFDWSVLISRDIMNIGMGNLLGKLTTGGTTGVKDDGTVWELFDRLVLKGKDVTVQFPRLRCVSYVQNLESVYRQTPGKTGVDSIEDMQKVWLVSSIAKLDIVQPNSWVMVKMMPGIPKLNKKYSCKSGLYTFDNEVLKPYFENMVARIDYYQKGLEAEDDNLKKKEAKEVLDVTKSEVEKLLDEICESESGEKKVYKTLCSLNFNTEENGISIILADMSSSGKDKYGELLKNAKERGW